MSAFDLEIIDEKKNPLIDRVELKVKIEHFGKTTPNRLEIKSKIAAMKGSDEKLTIIKDIKTHFGSTSDIGTIYIYDNSQDLKYYEPFHIQVRNLPKDKREEIYKLRRKKEPYKHLFEY